MFRDECVNPKLKCHLSTSARYRVRHGAPITNVGNPQNAGDAANRNYVDVTTLKFLPAVQQQSVGDTNGTAPMINLRGQSTCGGPTTGFADFKVFQNGSFVASGNLGIGTSPMEGKGYRTSWHTYKGAFRSGYADNEWDDVNVGFFSWAGGSNSTASGLYSLAFGDTNNALSTSSIAFGSGNEVKGAAGIRRAQAIANSTSAPLKSSDFVNGSTSWSNVSQRSKNYCNNRRMNTKRCNCRGGPPWPPLRSKWIFTR